MAGTKRRGDVASLIFIYLWPPSELYTVTLIDYALIHHENKKNSKKKNSPLWQRIETEWSIWLRSAIVLSTLFDHKVENEPWLII